MTDRNNTIGQDSSAVTSDTAEALKERMKELSCLYTISRIFEQENSIPDILQAVADIIPEAWQYPDKTVCRIELDDEVFTSTHPPASFPQDSFFGHPCIEESLHPKYAAAGTIRVCRTDMLSDDNAAEPLFLPEEEQLLETIAERLGHEIDRIRMEQKLYTSEEQSRTTLQSIGDGVIVTDTAGIITSINPAAQQLTGWGQNEAVGKPLDAVFHIIGTRSRKPVPSPVTNVLETGRTAGLANHTSLIDKTGNEYFIADSAAPIRDDSGEISGVVLVFRDISSEYSTAEAVRQSEELNRAIISCSPLPLFSIDLDGYVRTWNAAAEKVFGWTAAEAVGQKLPLIPPNKQEEFAGNISRILKDNGFMNEEFVRQKKDGTRIPIRLSTAPIYDDSGEAVGIMAVIEDLSEKKKLAGEQERLREQLQQSQKMNAIGRLAGGIAHDFNNMMNVIIGYAELAQQELDSPDNTKQYLQEIHKAAGRTSEITQQLLTFARKQTVRPKIIDLNHTIDSMLNMIRRLIGEDITVSWKPSEQLHPITIDPSQIDQILANLCVNARDAMASGGTIIIETADTELDELYCAQHPGCFPGKYVMLSVSDNGHGMDKETVSNIFEPFYTSKEGGNAGTGLGLSTVFGIVKQNSGHITVYSEPGKGTTFRIYFPSCREEKKQAGPSVSLPLPLGYGETVLVAEDESSILRLTAAMLKQLGYTPLPAAEPGTAVALAKDHGSKIDLLLTDVIMPDMNGRDLAEQVRKLRASCRVLYMSGYTADVIAHHGVLDKDTAFLQKPFTMAELAEKVRDALDS